MSNLKIVKLHAQGVKRSGIEWVINGGLARGCARRVLTQHKIETDCNITANQMYKQGQYCQKLLRLMTHKLGQFPHVTNWRHQNSMSPVQTWKTVSRPFRCMIPFLRTGFQRLPDCLVLERATCMHAVLHMQGAMLAHF